MGPDEAQNFRGLSHDTTYATHALRLGHVQGLLAKLEAEKQQIAHALLQRPVTQPSSLAVRTENTREIFLVHGHDNEAKESMARFLEKVGLRPIILHEQPNAGRTIIETFETYSGDTAFAVVLLTPDDVGRSASSSGTLKPRARQNVIMELDYFLGRLGRTRVCALHKGGVELPSDYQGVVYTDMDSAGAWRTKLAQEFVQAKLGIDLTGLLGS